MALEIGHYMTAAGSHVHVKTRNAGSWTADFDRLEEPHACFDCHSIDVDSHERALVWCCDVCGGGMAELKSVTLTTES